MDIILNKNGDICLTKKGDIRIGGSVAQKIRIKLLWFINEWRWNPAEGIDYFQLLDKGSDISYFEGVIRSKIFEVEEVVEVGDVQIVTDSKSRNTVIRFTAYTDDEVIDEEVTLHCTE